MTDISDQQAGELRATAWPAVGLRDVYDRDTERPNADCVAYLYELLRERSTEDDAHVNISHRTLPSWPEHCGFVLSSPYREWFVVVTAEGPIGTVYATRNNEIGIVLGRAHRGKGYGTRAVRTLLGRLQPLPEIKGFRRGCWLANINPANEPSIRMFAKLGARHISNTYELP